MRPTPWLVTLVAILGCSRPPALITAQQWNQIYCTTYNHVRSWDPLVAYAGHAPAPIEGPILAVMNDEAALDDTVVPDDALVATLTTSATGAPPRTLLLSLEPSLPAAEVVRYAAAAHAAGYQRLGFTVTVPENPRPAPFDPLLAKQILAATASLDSNEARNRVLFDALKVETDACGAARSVFEAVAAAPRNKCGVLARGVERIQAKCGERAPQILTLLQISDLGGKPVGSIEFEWTPDDGPIASPPGATWTELVQLLGADPDRKGHIALAP